MRRVCGIKSFIVISKLFTSNMLERNIIDDPPKSIWSKYFLVLNLYNIGVIKYTKVKATINHSIAKMPLVVIIPRYNSGMIDTGRCLKCVYKIPLIKQNISKNI